MESVTVQNKKELTSFLTLRQYVGYVLCAALVVCAFLPFVPVGLKVLAVICALIVSGTIAVIKYASSFVMTLDKDTFSVGHGTKTETFNYSDVTAFENTGTHFIIRAGKTIKLALMNLDMDDLNKLVDKFASRGIELTETESTSLMARLNAPAIAMPVLGVMSLLSFFYLFTSYRYFYSNMPFMVLMAIVIPLVVAIHYMYLLLHGEMEQIENETKFYLCTLLLPLVSGFMVLFIRASMSNPKPLCIGAFVLFFVIYVIYKLIFTLVGGARDTMFTIFILLYCGFILLFLNNVVLPSVSVEEKTATIEEMGELSSHFGIGKRLTALIDGDSETTNYNISDDVYDKYYDSYNNYNKELAAAVSEDASEDEQNAIKEKYIDDLTIKVQIRQGAFGVVTSVIE